MERGAFFLSHQTYEHICERRDCERPEHRTPVMSRLESVISAPSHVGCLSNEPNKLDLWRGTEGDPSGVLVCLKCLAGETWVSTAFPMGRKTLRKHLNQCRLHPVAGA